MGKNDGPELPPPPTFQEDPRFKKGINQLNSLGNRLTSFDFDGELAPLQKLIDLDPEVTQLALQSAESSLTPAFERNIQNIKNQAANAGALESSTFTDALSQATADVNSQLQAITTSAALEDRTRALQNTFGIFGLGTDLTQNATALAGDNQNQINNFNLSNYENQVAQAINSQGSSRGGFLGALQGGVGGALAGSSFGPFGAVAGGVAGALGGGLGSSGTGGAILSAAPLTSGFSFRPGKSAANSKDIVKTSRIDKLQDQLGGFGGFTDFGFNPNSFGLD